MELAAPLLRFADCRALDAASIAGGVPEQQLMGQAALASLHALDASGALARCRRLIILCGPGNNGGDGYALACMLAGAVSIHRADSAALAVQLYATAPPKSDAAQFYARTLGAICEQHTGGVRLSMGDAADFLRLAPAGLTADDLVVEALLGIGQTEAPRGTIAKVLEHLKALREQTGVYTVSLDVPAGLREDAPAEAGETQRLVPDEIHSYGVDKAALRLDPALAAASRVRVLAMGFLPLPSNNTAAREKSRKESREDSGHPVLPAIRSLRFADDDRGLLRELTNKRPLSHKYQAGHGLLIGGSPGMEGALMMAARAFFAAGGGILHAVVPDAESRKFLTTALPGVMFLDHSQPLPESLRPRSIAIGPGLALEDLEATAQLLGPLLERLRARHAGSDPAPESAERPWLILDAGALPFIRDARLPESLRERSILTPHTGEWKRLGGAPIDCVDALDAAARLHANELGGYCLVKDAVSVLLPPDLESDAGIRHRPNPALAVAGSGDNLCGILLALFARRGRDHPKPAPGAFQKIAAALELLDRAARLERHPRADQFPDLIRRCLE